MQTDTLLLIDLSSLAHPIWHVSQNEPDPNHTSVQVLARVRALSSEYPHAAICCDSGKSFRSDIDPTYKAQRPERLGTLMHQIALAEEALRTDGYPVWKVVGFEADDIIASATARALAIPDTNVLIASDDKDQLALVSDRVTVHRLTSGLRMDPAAVKAKMGVRPEQVPDWLALCGDTSDNIQGAKGIGPKTAAELLGAYGTLEALYAAIDGGATPTITPAKRTALVEFRERWPVVRQLVALRSDVAIPFEEIAAERTVPAMEGAVDDESAEIGEGTDWAPTEQGHERARNALMNDAEMRHFYQLLDGGAAVDGPLQASAAGQEACKPEAVATALTASPSLPLPAPVPVSRALARQQPDVLPALEFERQLEPRSMDDAVKLAQRMFESRLFSAYGTPQAVLATVLAGRELGMPAMASLRAFHILEGRPTLSAGTIQSLVLRSGKAKYFRCTERTAERATFETQRGDDPPIALSVSVEDGRRAWPKDEAAFLKSGWGRNPADMCVARAGSKLARLVYPDVVSGLYSTEEFD